MSASPSDETGAEKDPDEAVTELEQKADALREELGDLVGELDKRRHRAVKPAVVVAAALGFFCVAGLVMWRVRRRQPTRIANLRKALQRAAEGDEPTKGAPGKRILGAAGAAFASVLVKKLAQKVLSDRDQRTAAPVA
jgi:hypothetical protein